LHVDSHVHIGQFDEYYYDPTEIVEIVMSSGIREMWFSSTTSCTDSVRYTAIEKEIQDLLTKIPYSPETVRSLLWYSPDYIAQGVNVETACNAIPYKGIKLHPYANHWDFADSRHNETLHGLFDHAAKNGLPVLIHTRESGRDNADRFESFFAEYKSAQCVLAHCRPLDTTLSMLEKYPNVSCDTSFVPQEHIRQIVSAGYGDRVLTGTDFPITHYFRTKYPEEGQDNNITLREQYKQDIERIVACVKGLSEK